ncbi:MAG: hypothetical protein ACLFUF_08600 [Opitutales bacterium]
MSYRVIENETGHIVAENLSRIAALNWTRDSRLADFYTVEEQSPTPSHTGLLADPDIGRIDNLILDTVEELMVLRMHLANDENEEAREKLFQSGVNLQGIGSIMESGVRS